MIPDDETLAQLAAASDVSLPHTIRHFLYIPKSDDAEPISRVLRQHSFDVKDRLGGDGVNWLILATHRVVPTKQLLASTRSIMESLAARYHGEYDGWEAEIAKRSGG